MSKHRVLSVIYLLVAALAAYFIVTTEANPTSRFKFKLGLDLAGGTHLLYKADIKDVAPEDVPDSMQALREVIERRVNLFGVSEPLVQLEGGGVLGASGEHRLIVELPGVTDVNQAIALIGQTPLLEFRLLKEGADTAELASTTPLDEIFISTGLTGRYLKRAQVQFDGTTGAPTVSLVFNSEGADLFAKITKENVGRVLAIFLDGVPISTPVIQSEISGGEAEISGGFTLPEARELVRNLNYGALPVPIELVSTQNVGASLGAKILHGGVRAGIIGLIIVALFMLIWYRIPGVVAALALAFYAILMLAIFKLVGVTLTAAGIAGFIISLGIALDANVIIFERIKEERENSRDDFPAAVSEAFRRAWLSIRDGNVTSILGAIVLFWFGSSLIEGFALILGIGVALSMITAIWVTKAFMLAVSPKKITPSNSFAYGSGLKK